MLQGDAIGEAFGNVAISLQVFHVVGESAPGVRGLFILGQGPSPWPGAAFHVGVSFPKGGANLGNGGKGVAVHVFGGVFVCSSPARSRAVAAQGGAGGVLLCVIDDNRAGVIGVTGNASLRFIQR